MFRPDYYGNWKYVGGLKGTLKNWMEDFLKGRENENSSKG